MTAEQWEQRLTVLDGGSLPSPPTGFIMDSP